MNPSATNVRECVPRAATTKLSRFAATFALSALMLTAVWPAQAKTFKVLHRFTGQPDGAIPSAGLVLDAKDNLYGTTFGGGASGNGTVFEITSAGKESVLYRFVGGTDGVGPAAGLIQANGKLYGTTLTGGINSFGAVFQLNAVGKQTVLASLDLGDGGGYSEAGLIRDPQGNLYGTTSGYNGGYGNGAVFKVAPDGTLTILYNFTGGTDGLSPVAGLVRDTAGNLYGTTYRGGTFGYGTVFELTPDGIETVLYGFTGGTDGSFPAAGLLRTSAGNLFGTTTGGGLGYGTVFKLTPNRAETVLHSFSGPDGYYPIASLVQDTNGNLYGTTEFGGTHGQGTIFKLTKAGVETVLHNFTGGTDGGAPTAPLVRDKLGNLYGTTSGGASSKCLGGCGVAFELIP